MHMVAVATGFRNGLVGTGWANSCLGCTDVVRQCYYHLLGASFLSVKAQNRCFLAENGKFVNEWVCG